MSCMIAVCLIPLVLPPSSTQTPEPAQFQCFPNNTITVRRPVFAISVFAHNIKGKCAAKFSSHDPDIAVITECEKDLDVSVTFSNYVFEGVDVLGGEQTETYAFNCNEIPAGGVIKQAVVAYNSSLAVQDKAEYPDVQVWSAIYTDISEVELALEVATGQPIFLTIHTQADFFIKPEACWAYGGQEVTASAPNVKLIESGCSLDTTLCGDFEMQAPNNGSKIGMVLKGFGFYGSNFITILCSLRMCKAEHSERCVFSCEFRKRRAGTPMYVGSTEGFASVSTTIRVVNLLREWNQFSEATNPESQLVWVFLTGFSLLVV